MAKRRRRKKVNHIWEGIKGFFWIFWVVIKYIGLGFYYAAMGIGWFFAWLARKIKAPKFPKNNKTIDVETKETTRDEIETKQERKTREKAEKQRPDTPPEFNELDAEHTTAGDFEHFAESYHHKSQVMLIFGKRGSGKSTLGFRIMENIAAKTGRPGFVLGVKQELLPKWISQVESVDEVKNGGVILVDEGAIAFSARQSMKKANVALGKLLAIARHKDLTLLFITQNTGMIDKNVLNMTDVIIAKQGSLLQKKMERAVVRDFVEKADKAIKSVEREERIKYCYIFADDFEGLCKISLPSFWSTKISKSNA
ncbi:hypothetical protein GF342_04775 [Candidatus Woesearchaeota archaeon]|nr:hypothetical protein [Candidatus Woesearchaeota archaeon]